MINNVFFVLNGSRFMISSEMKNSGVLVFYLDIIKIFFI